MSDERDYSYMRAALEEASIAAAHDEVPIGAILVNPASGDIVARAGNRTRTLSDPTAHAEILAIRAACEKAGAQRIPHLHLYVTLEPCAMCAAAISFARIEKVIFAAKDEKGGGVLHGGRFYDQPTCHHRPIIESGLLADESSTILRAFFKARR